MDTTHDEGWIKLHRKSVHSQVFQSDGLWKVWTWCLMKANHEDIWMPVTTGKGTTELLVKRGQFVFGRKSAAKALKMDESTVYKRMMKLKNMGNCNIESNTHCSLVTILNYGLYQGIPHDEVTGKVTPKEHPSNTNKNDKNEKKLKNGRKKESDPRVKEFRNFWGETFQRETGQPYVFSYGKEGSLIQDLLQVHSLETLQDMTKIFFQDERCKQRGLDIGIFKLEINRLIGLKGTNPLKQAKKDLGWRDNSV